MSVYAIQAIDGGPIKVGYSSSPEQRLAQLQTAHHAELVILYAFEAEPRHEALLQEELFELRVRGEWYADEPQVLLHLRTAEVGIRLESLLRALCRNAIAALGTTFDRDDVLLRLQEFSEAAADGLAEVNEHFLTWSRGLHSHEVNP